MGHADPLRICVQVVLWHFNHGGTDAPNVLSMFLHYTPHSLAVCANAEPSRVHSLQWLSGRPNDLPSICRLPLAEATPFHRLYGSF